jgi:excisionase family DNA binding protein
MTSSTSSNELLIDVPEAARRLGLGRSFVYQRLIQTGQLRSIKVGGARRILVSDLEAFVANLAGDPPEDL